MYDHDMIECQYNKNHDINVYPTRTMTPNEKSSHKYQKLYILNSLSYVGEEYEIWPKHHSQNTFHG